MTSGCRRRCRWIVLLLTVVYPAWPSHGQEFPTGQIVEHVRCRADGSQSYALYLPSDYSPQRRWPILYGLDAGARGYLPVQRFRSAAEKYGYIVAGSNNSRNGPMTIVNAAIQAMFEDTRARFSIDDRRVYVSGFSGGARAVQPAHRGGQPGECRPRFAAAGSSGRAAVRPPAAHADRITDWSVEGASGTGRVGHPWSRARSASS